MLGCVQIPSSAYLLSLLMALEEIQTVKSLATAWTIAREHRFRVVVEFMSSSMLCPREDLEKS